MSNDESNANPPAATTPLAAMHDLVLDTLQPTVHETAAGKVLVTSDDHTVHDLEAILDEHRAHPKRATGGTRHDTLTSLIDHAKRYKGADTVAHVAMAAAPYGIDVVYNANPAAGADRGGWSDHRARYAFPESDAWARWTRAHGQKLTVAQFAELLEERITDVRDPASAVANLQLPGVRYATASELLALAEGLSVRVEQKVVDQKRLQNGTATMTFSEGHTDERGEPLKIPTGFLLGVPVFLGGDAYAIPVRLRYQVKDKAVLWTVLLHEAETAKRDAIVVAASRFAEETGVPTFMGAAG